MTARIAFCITTSFVNDRGLEGWQAFYASQPVAVRLAAGFVNEEMLVIFMDVNDRYDVWLSAMLLIDYRHDRTFAYRAARIERLLGDRARQSPISYSGGMMSSAVSRRMFSVSE